MCCASEIAEALNEAERSCLKELCRGSGRSRIPSPHAEKLLTLGLAEVLMGHLEMTSTGRRAAMALHA
jgi:hypothetical protein